MKPFFLSSLSTPPAPQEAGIWALTSHLADISHLESCGGVSWDLGPPTHLPACHLPPAPTLQRGCVELLLAGGGEVVEMPTIL